MGEQRACASTVRSDAFASRFDQDIVNLLQDKDSKSTNASTKLAIDLLKQFCAAKERAFKNTKP